MKSTSNWPSAYAHLSMNISKLTEGYFKTELQQMIKVSFILFKFKNYCLKFLIQYLKRI